MSKPLKSPANTTPRGGWTVETPTRAVYRKGRYRPRVCGKLIAQICWSYTVTVLVENGALTVTIDDEDAPSVQCGANLSTTIPAHIMAQLCLGQPRAGGGRARPPSLP